MSTFDAYLLPFDYFRRWQYQDLVPSLLYCDRVSLPVAYSGSYAEAASFRARPLKLLAPEKIEGVPDEHWVDGLYAWHHRYFWPIRELIAEGVLVPWFQGGADIAEMCNLVSESYKNALETLQTSGKGNEVDKLLTSAARYYDRWRSTSIDLWAPQIGESPMDKTCAVLAWLHLNIGRQPSGWQHVTLHPDGYTVLNTALALFDNLRLWNDRTTVDELSEQVSLPSRVGLVAHYVVKRFLRKELPGFQLGHDPGALSELLEIRRKRQSELQAFRQVILMTAHQLKSEDPTELELDIQARLEPEFEKVRRAMSSPWRRTSGLVLREAGTLIMVGGGAFIGAAIGGPAEAASGATAGTALAAAARKGIAKIAEGIGDRIGKILKGTETELNQGLVYLFHAQNVLRKPSAK